MREATNEVKVERDIRVTMPDGVELLTDLFHPVGVDDAPTILERTPYGRAGVSGTGFGPMLACLEVMCRHRGWLWAHLPRTSPCVTSSART